MIANSKDIPLPLLALLAARVVDSEEFPSHRARFVPVKFDSGSEAYALSEFLWANVNRNTKCDGCRKHFDWLEHPDRQYVFSVALDSENRVNFLHRGCAANSRAMRVLIEGSNYSDVCHELQVSWHSPWGTRAVIASSDGLGQDATVGDLLQAQRRAQVLAAHRAMLAELKGEIERRRAYKASMLEVSATGNRQRPLTARELKSWLQYHTTRGAYCPTGCGRKFDTDFQWLWVMRGRVYFICPNCATEWVRDRAEIVEPGRVTAFLSTYQWRNGGHGLEVIAGVVQ
jgi:hypothetical protein